MTAKVLSSPIDVKFEEIKNGDIFCYLEGGRENHPKYLMMNKDSTSITQSRRVGDLPNYGSSYVGARFVSFGIFRIFAREVIDDEII